MLIPNTGAHMVRRGGRFRSEMRRSIVDFVELLNSAMEAETVQRIGSSDDACMCQLCHSQVAELETHSQLCTACPLCSGCHHASCLAERFSEASVMDAIFESTASRRAGLLDQVMARLCLIYKGPLSKVGSGPTDALCLLCSTLVVRALKGPD